MTALDLKAVTSNGSLAGEVSAQGTCNNIGSNKRLEGDYHGIRVSFEAREPNPGFAVLVREGSSMRFLSPDVRARYTMPDGSIESASIQLTRRGRVEDALIEFKGATRPNGKGQQYTMELSNLKPGASSVQLAFPKALVDGIERDSLSFTMERGRAIGVISVLSCDHTIRWQSY